MKQYAIWFPYSRPYCEGEEPIFASDSYDAIVDKAQELMRERRANVFAGIRVSNPDAVGVDYWPIGIARPDENGEPNFIFRHRDVTENDTSEQDMRYVRQREQSLGSAS